MDKKERSEALKLLAGGTIVFFVFVMIVTPQLRANWVGVLVGSFILMLIVVAFVYGQRGPEEEQGEVEESLILTARRLGIDPEGKTRRQIQDEILALPPKAAAEPSRPAVREVFKEREVITREIVKIRCRHCGRLFEEKLDRCPHCGAPQ